jgi:hypothetical protein
MGVLSWPRWARRAAPPRASTQESAPRDAAAEIAGVYCRRCRHVPEGGAHVSFEGLCGVLLGGGRLRTSLRLGVCDVCGGPASPEGARFVLGATRAQALQAFPGD